MKNSQVSILLFIWCVNSEKFLLKNSRNPTRRHSSISIIAIVFLRSALPKIKSNLAHFKIGTLDHNYLCLALLHCWQIFQMQRFAVHSLFPTGFHFTLNTLCQLFYLMQKGTGHEFSMMIMATERKKPRTVVTPASLPPCS